MMGVNVNGAWLLLVVLWQTMNHSRQLGIVPKEQGGPERGPCDGVDRGSRATDLLDQQYATFDKFLSRGLGPFICTI
ncbi:hypothetical protein HYC85_018367 [Camellia sinensis]|uniref:Secreted protein n=1 Tax=Camellia sinensis TaxID=4442 RepID=A0A7J7GUF6_CAMSI|nr:hypothetical protein HYC85_018367 [Camellia sinensis]